MDSPVNPLTGCSEDEADRDDGWEEKVVEGMVMNDTDELSDRLLSCDDAVNIGRYGSGSQTNSTGGLNLTGLWGEGFEEGKKSRVSVGKGSGRRILVSI
jgi:hypothetical protein